MAMNKEEIMEAIKSLSHSHSHYQSFYDYLYRFFKEHPEALERFEKQNFKDSVDMIMRIEG